MRVTGIAEAASTIPMLAVSAFQGYESDVSFPTDLIWFLAGGSGLAGMCLWSHLVRYKVKPDQCPRRHLRAPHLRPARAPIPGSFRQP